MFAFLLGLVLVYWAVGFGLNAIFHPIQTIKLIFRVFGWIFIGCALLSCCA